VSSSFSEADVAHAPTCAETERARHRLNALWRSSGPDPLRKCPRYSQVPLDCRAMRLRLVDGPPRPKVVLVNDSEGIWMSQHIEGKIVVITGASSGLVKPLHAC
jgi:hypothetical protein